MGKLIACTFCSLTANIVTFTVEIIKGTEITERTYILKGVAVNVFEINSDDFMKVIIILELKLTDA